MKKTLSVFATSAALLISTHAKAQSVTSAAVGTGPIQVVCTDKSGNQKTYNVNMVFFKGNSDKTLFVNGYGSGAGSEGIDQIEGNCGMSLNPDFVM